MKVEMVHSFMKSHDAKVSAAGFVPVCKQIMEAFNNPEFNRKELE